MTPKKYLITSALPYINGIKHLGNLAGSMLPADIYTRFLRQSGKDVLYICATDDHGTPAEIAAYEAGLDVQTFSDQQHEIQKKIYEDFGLEFDHFGRTSREQNIELTQHFARSIVEKNYADIRSMKQIYSIDDERFLPDRYVEGECPICGYDKARGDQCENCTTLLDPEQLINPRSTISGSTNLEIRETKHLFLSLSKLEKPLQDWIDRQEKWPHIVRSIAYKWLNEGLHDRCITRDLKWGIPANTIEGLDGKVFYVWFDAPIGYIAATKEWSDKDPEHRNWKEYWYNSDENVHYVQFMAKDNIPFHTISFPATQIATDEPWKRVDYIKGFNWLNYYGQKFSTSQKRGIFTDQALELYPADMWRYYLVARLPENSDSSFTWPDFQTVVNKDLNNVLGNFINRVMRFTESKFDGKIPAINIWNDIEEQYANELQQSLDAYNTHMENLEMKKAIESLRRIWVLGNEYVDAAAPWTAIKNDKDRAAAILNFSFNLIRIISILSRPIIPFTADKIAAALNIENHNWVKSMRSDLKFFNEDAAFKNPGLLFNRIEDETISELEIRFSGS